MCILQASTLRRLVPMCIWHQEKSFRQLLTFNLDSRMNMHGVGLSQEFQVELSPHKSISGGTAAQLSLTKIHSIPPDIKICEL